MLSVPICCACSFFEFFQRQPNEIMFKLAMLYVGYADQQLATACNYLKITIGIINHMGNVAVAIVRMGMDQHCMQA